MTLPPYFMVFDVESVGLHGEAYAFGYVVVGRDGVVACAGGRHVPFDEVRGGEEGMLWAARNARPGLGWSDAVSPAGSATRMRDSFWSAWRAWHAKGAVLAADCPWPVEANFLSACVADRPGRRWWEGPYPLVDVASVMLAAGMDPKAEYERLPDELPRHDPLADARQSARLLTAAVNKIRFEKLNGGHS